MARARKGERAALALRIDVALLARVDGYAARVGLDRTAALCELVALGLGEADAVAGVGRREGGEVVLSPRESARQPAPQASAANPRRTLVGYDPTTGAPIYRGGEQ
jgi:hypothetical protein